MQLTFEINLSQADEADLAGILKTPANELPNALAPYAKAAAMEYIQMFLGQKVFTRGSDMREFRLLLLIQSAFNNQIPEEQTVSALFQCTRAQSRSLLRAVMSKYQYQLRSAINASLKQTINNVHKDANQRWIVTVQSEGIVDELNKILSGIDGSQDQVVRRTGKLAEYELQPAAYNALCNHFQLQPKQ